MKLECSWSSSIDIAGLSKEHQQRIKSIGLYKWIDELSNKKEEKRMEVVAAPTVKKKNVFESAVIVMVKRGWPQLSRSVSSDDVAVNADKKRIHVSKDLFNCKEINQFISYDSQIDSLLEQKCVPFYLQKGVYLLPIDLFHEVENAFVQHAAGREPYIDAICNVYDDAVMEAKGFLGDLFRQSDYLTKDAFREKFKFRWNYLQIGVSDKLDVISKEIAQREADKWQADWTEASGQMQHLLRVQLQELVAHACDRLAPAENGKKKVFRDSMLANIHEFLTTFPSRNLTEDGELAKVIDQMKQLTNGVSPEDLRDNEALRDNIQKGFSTAKAILDTLVVEQPMRKVRLNA